MSENNQIKKEGKDIAEKRFEFRKEKIGKWFSDPYNALFVAVMVIAIILRILVLAVAGHQSLWWDETAYALESKHIALDTPSTGFHAGRPILGLLLWVPFYKFGIGEFAIRILEMLFSLGTIVLIYYVGLKLFNKKVGLIASVIYTFFWIDLFYMPRFLPDTIGVFFTILFISIFFKSRENQKYFYWLGPIYVFAYMAREQNVLLLPILLIYLLFTEKFKFLKTKKFWFMIIFLLVASIPYLTFYQHEMGDPLANLKWRIEKQININISGPTSDIVGLFVYTKNLPFIFTPTLFLILIIAGVLMMLFYLFIGFDLIWKEKKNERLNNYLLLFLWIFIPYVLFDIQHRIFDERYIMMIYPAVFILAGSFIDYISDWVKKYNKFLSILLIVLVLGFVCVPNFQKGYSLLKSKADSYWQVQEAGIWLKQNSLPSDIILTASVPQITYYSERKAIHPINLGENQTDFENNFTKVNPNYIFISVYETQQSWFIPWVDKNKNFIVPILGYPVNKAQQIAQGNVAAILYKVSYNINNSLSNSSLI